MSTGSISVPELPGQMKRIFALLKEIEGFLKEIVVKKAKKSTQNVAVPECSFTLGLLAIERVLQLTAEETLGTGAGASHLVRFALRECLQQAELVGAEASAAVRSGASISPQLEASQLVLARCGRLLLSLIEWAEGVTGKEAPSGRRENVNPVTGEKDAAFGKGARKGGEQASANPSRLLLLLEALRASFVTLCSVPSLVPIATLLHKRPPASDEDATEVDTNGKGAVELVEAHLDRELLPLVLRLLDDESHTEAEAATKMAVSFFSLLPGERLGNSLVWTQGVCKAETSASSSLRKLLLASLLRLDRTVNAQPASARKVRAPVLPVGPQ